MVRSASVVCEKPEPVPSGDDIDGETIRRNLQESELSPHPLESNRDATAVAQVDGTDEVASEAVEVLCLRLGSDLLSLDRSESFVCDAVDLARSSGGCQPGNAAKEIGLPEEVSKEAFLDVKFPRELFCSPTSSKSVNDGAAINRATSCLTACSRDPATGVMSVRGRRREMEDSVAVVHRFLHLPCKVVGGCLGIRYAGQDDDVPFHFFGVYDGHGGSQAANFCKERLHVTLVEEVHALLGANNTSTESIADFWGEKWEKVMSTTFLRIDAEIEGRAWKRNSDGKEGAMERLSDPIAPETVGCTAVVAVVGSCQIIIANCGDSRAVLSRGGRAIDLSVDHKPDRADELSRIEAAGGRVICWNGYRVYGVLAMSRAIGDRYLKPYVIADPEVKCLSRSEDDECLILATDGLWDVLTSDEVCEAARKRLDSGSTVHAAISSSASTAGSIGDNAEAAAVLLTKMALAQGSNDNVSVVVVDLKDRDRP